MSLEVPSRSILRFGVFEVDLRAGELHKQGMRIKLQEQPFHVLTVLLKSPGEVVTREELRSKSWPADTFVDFDNSLNTAINKLREALGDSADNPRLIETLPRRGYRFIAPVTGTDGPARETATGESAASPTRSRKIIVTATITVLVAVIAGGMFWRAREARRLTEKDTVVLGDFANSTGDAVFDEALKQGLRVQLEQSPYLNILSDQKVNEELQLMGRPKDERLTQDITREICQRTSSKAFLIGTISRLGTHYVVGLKALNCQTGDGLASEQAEAGSREQVLRLLSESATSMRQKLGESLPSIKKYDVPLEQATTLSVEALKAYSLGMENWRQKGETAAIPFFQRAIDLDPKFAMAYARLGRVIGDPSSTAKNTRKAYELRTNVSERERLYIEAHYFDSVVGDLEKAAEFYEIWQQTYPRDVETYQNLANIYRWVGRYDTSLGQAREAARLEPGAEENYLSLSVSLVALDHVDEAEVVLNQAEQRKLKGESLLLQRYLVAFLKGDTERMDQLVTAASGSPETEKLFLEFHESVDEYHGRLKKAQTSHRRSAELFGHSKASWVAAWDLADEAFLEAEVGAVQQARAHLHEALTPDANEFVAAEIAMSLVLTGDVRRGEDLATELNKRFPSNTRVQRYFLPEIHAAAALQSHDAELAIRLLRVINPYEMGAHGWGTLYPIYQRGLAYLMLHNGRAAAAEFQKIIEHPGLVALNPVGVLSRLGLARAYALQGDTAKSRAAYQDFLALWKDADPDIPIMRQAKVEYTELQ
jgi:DNA-binding winged helix-turn-helix (wHTH) protein/Tfp pilus assembly protein PilF